VLGDLTANGVAVTEIDIRTKMGQLLELAVEQVKAGI
jgi:hypothetical protein